MYRVTTPKFTFILPISTDDCEIVQVTFRQGKHKLVKQSNGSTTPSGMTFDDDKVIVILTQEETKAFDYGYDAYVQIRALTEGGEAYASKSYKLMVWDVEDDSILGGLSS